MKRNLLLAILVGIALFITACSQAEESSSEGSSGSSESSEVIELDFNTQTPSTHTYNKDAIEPWAKLVEEKTDGKVKINIFESGALGKNATAYQDLQSGVYDIGYIVSSTVKDTDLYPTSIADLPFAFEDNHMVTKVMQRFTDEFLSDSFSENVTFGAIASTDPYHVMSVKPIETLEDFKDLRIRNAGEDNIALMQAWGAAPMTVELSEMYQAFDRGMLDATSYTGVGSIGLSLFEVAPYLTMLNMNSFQLIYVMNTESFNKLPDDIQTLFKEELFPQLGEMINEAYDNTAEEAFTIYEENGGEIINMSDEELAKLKAPVEDIWNDWVTRTNEKGFPGDEMMEFFKNTLIEEGGSLPF